MSANPRTGLFAVCIVASLTVVRAQSTPVQKPVIPTPDETVTLSPFEVNAADDTGYRATNTLDGSRLNTALRDTPDAISIFTR